MFSRSRRSAAPAGSRLRAREAAIGAGAMPAASALGLTSAAPCTDAAIAGLFSVAASPARRRFAVRGRAISVIGRRCGGRQLLTTSPGIPASRYAAPRSPCAPVAGLLRRYDPMPSDLEVAALAAAMRGAPRRATPAPPCHALAAEAAAGRLEIIAHRRTRQGAAPPSPGKRGGAASARLDSWGASPGRAAGLGPSRDDRGGAARSLAGMPACVHHLEMSLVLPFRNVTVAGSGGGRAWSLCEAQRPSDARRTALPRHRLFYRASDSSLGS